MQKFTFAVRHFAFTIYMTYVQSVANYKCVNEHLFLRIKYTFRESIKTVMSFTVAYQKITARKQQQM